MTELESEDPDSDRRSQDVIDEDTEKVRIASKRCSTCIFWTDGRSVVSAERAAEIISENVRRQCLLSCHSTLYRSDLQPAVCNGYWAEHANVLAGRLASRLIGTVRIDVPERKD